MRSIIHVDMDAFFASVEQRDDPRLRGRPVVVGGHARRGVVLAASYEARPYGVRSALPMARALQLLPREAVVVPPRFFAYAEASERIFEIFHRYTPLVEALSLDEAFLDVTASERLFGSGEQIARQIRVEIAQSLELPASAGIAASKLVAKIASDVAKPNGQVAVPQEETEAFLAPLPVKRLWGVGPKLEARLHLLGLNRVGDLAMRDPAWLAEKLGASGPALWSQARGDDDRPVVPDREAKSVGAEDTFAEDLLEERVLLEHIHSQALRVARRLRRSELSARTVQLKLKSSRHRTRTLCLTLERPTDDGQVMFRAAEVLFHRAALTEPVRLTGVSAHGLVKPAEQLELIETVDAKGRRLNATLDLIAERFGAEKLVPADLLGSEVGEREDRNRSRGGGSRMDLPGRRPRE